MYLPEFVGKQIFSQSGIPIPEGKLIDNIEEIPFDAENVVLKAQVLSGGRGKQGGIVSAKTYREAQKGLLNILGKEIGGELVKKVLIEKRIDIENEFYVSFLLSRNTGLPVLIASSFGGMDIESVPKGNIVMKVIDPLLGLREFILRDLVNFLDIKKESINKFNEIVKKLYDIFICYDAEIVEINPLALTKENSFVALDSKIVIDDNAIYRQKDFSSIDRNLTDFERVEFDLGISAAQLDSGNIIVVSSGAGLQMATVDSIQILGGEVAAAVDLGGSVLDYTQEGIEKLKKIIKPIKELNPKVVLFNFFLQTARCDVLAKAIGEVLGDFTSNCNIVIRIKGNYAEEAKASLEKFNFIIADSFDEAVKKTMLLAKM